MLGRLRELAKERLLGGEVDAANTDSTSHPPSVTVPDGMETAAYLDSLMLSTKPSILDVMKVARHASRASAGNIMVQMGAGDDAGDDGNPEIVWSVDIDQAWAAGCARAPESVLLVPRIPSSVMHAVMLDFPSDLYARHSDGPSTLAARLAASKELDDIHTLKGGKGPQRVRLNGTTYAAPRRTSMSVTLGEPHIKNGVEVVELFNYTSFGRLPQDWRARPMPRCVFDLGVCCWLSAMPWLKSMEKHPDPHKPKANPSLECPPTACQRLLYHGLFKGKMGRHRDNCSTGDLRQVLDSGVVSCNASGHASGGDENSQALNSYVMVMSLGTAPMVMTLSYPPLENLKAVRDAYVVHPSFQVPLLPSHTHYPLVLICFLHWYQVRVGPGTLFLFHPEDDLFFCHEASFSDSTLEDPESTRVAYVFRWLQVPRCFKTSDWGMQVPEELLEKQKQTKLKRQKERRKQFY